MLKAATVNIATYKLCSSANLKIVSFSTNRKSTVKQITDNTKSSLNQRNEEKVNHIIKKFKKPLLTKLFNLEYLYLVLVLFALFSPIALATFAIADLTSFVYAKLVLKISNDGIKESKGTGFKLYRA